MGMFRIVAGTVLIIAGSGNAFAQDRMVAGPAPGAHHGHHGGHNGRYVDRTVPGPDDRMVLRPPRGHDRERGRHRGGYPRHGGGWASGYWGYGGGGYVVTEVSPDMFGYFATDGAAEVVGEEAVYDYDRDYPYEFGRGRAVATAARKPRGPVRCETDLVPDENGKRKVAVRVCRN